MRSATRLRKAASLSKKLQAATDVIKKSIDALEPICQPNAVKIYLQLALARAEVAHG
jgi:hypothetical protein